MKPTKEELLDKAIKLSLDDDYYGLCMECGADIAGIEPDARADDCSECGNVRCVYGVDEIILMDGAPTP